jgi:hypothetical protein
MSRLEKIRNCRYDAGTGVGNQQPHLLLPQSYQLYCLMAVYQIVSASSVLGQQEKLLEPDPFLKSLYR